MARAVRNGKRIVYFGAGTSGRLAVMEAAELWPTFSVRASAVIAGGNGALLRAVEGAEDDRRAGGREAAFLRQGDLAVGITASGVTPWVVGVLRRARTNGAATVLITCNPHPAARARVVVALPTGPEPLTGSTRMNAGTATKIALNAMSTCAMAFLGKTWKNRMVDVVATNAKLRDRARRLVVELGGVAPADAARLLRETASAKEAIAAALLGCGVEEARRRLRRAGGHLGRALADRRGK
jgi:N-acetylmuramic acid 6-phosphate etherase